MKVEFNTYSNYNRQNYQKQNNSVTFGFHLKPQKVIAKDRIADISLYVSNLVGENPDKILKMINGASEKRLEFLQILAEKFNLIYIRSKKEPESFDFITNIFNSLTNPHREHFRIVRNANESFETLGKIFNLAKDKKTIKFVEQFRSDIMANNTKSPQMILDVLESPFKKEFIENFDKYSSYFELNLNEPNAIKNLETLIKQKRFNKEIFDKKLGISKLMKISALKNNSHIKPEEIEQYFTEESGIFLNEFFNKFLSFKKTMILPEINSANLMSMYKSTNAKNLKLRIDLLDDLKYAAATDKKGNDLVQPEIANMMRLFDRIDKDKYTRKFLYKVLDRTDINLGSFKQVNMLLDKIGSKKLAIYFDNFRRLDGAALDFEELISSLEKGIDNPFFETGHMKIIRRMSEDYGYRKRESIFSKGAKLFKKMYTKTKYVCTRNVNYTAPEAKYDIIKPAYIEPKVKVSTTLPAPIFKPIFQPAENITNNLPAPIFKSIFEPTAKDIRLKTTQLTPFEVALTEKSSLSEDAAKAIARLFKESPKARRLRVISDVDNLIKQKLKQSLLEKQQGEYAQTATKMRLTLLPEIFESIKLTRAADKASGKAHPRSSNKDALTLYKMINGKNRKLVKYMLQKTDANGNRIFEVKDIIIFIREHEKNISKSIIPDGTTKAVFTKEYYNKLYDGFVEKYGKLPPKKRNTQKV